MSKQLPLRLSDEEHDLLISLANCRGQSNAGFLRHMIHLFHDGIRTKLDEKALALLDEGKLDRVEYSKACARYQERKAANKQTVEALHD